MDEFTDPKAFDRTTMRDYRTSFKRREREKWQRVKEIKPSFKIIDVIVNAPVVDMTDIQGTDKEVAAAIDRFYHNDGRFLDPEIAYRPHMLDRFGKDYKLNAQGIYYYDFYSPRLVTSTRKVWVPSLDGIDWTGPGEESLRIRARVFAEHNLNNERWNKSEYAWEADAWSDVFGEMRNDPCLEIDKHDYFMMLAETDAVSCMLTGESVLVQRTPDATFGLATFAESDAEKGIWVAELLQSRLEKLLLHRKCGLLADPKWGETNLAFPFAVYEAKGWSGDCRVARRQACVAAAAYLDLLDNLVRRPGPVESVKPYQTPTSHHYQVFALTSFGAHWHLLVGYRRPREAEEHAGLEGMSETVFQKIWSGRVIDERTAWELLSLIEQIHLWAITEFRTFILEHLKPWHKFCEENYLLEWDSVYDIGNQLKRKRNCEEGDDLPLPAWTNQLTEPNRQKIQLRAKESLAKALEEDRLRKGKGKCADELGWVCTMGDCARSQDTSFGTGEAFLDHIASFHHAPERDLVLIKRCLDKADAESSSGETSGPLIILSQRPAKRVRVA